MPVDKDSYFNQIDIGISLCFIDICLTNNIIDYEKNCIPTAAEMNNRRLTRNI